MEDLNLQINSTNCEVLENLLNKSLDQKLSSQEEYLLAKEMFKFAKENFHDDCDNNEWTAVKRIKFYLLAQKEEGANMESLAQIESIVNYFFKQQREIELAISKAKKMGDLDSDGMNFMIPKGHPDYL